jgi:hypothetical protein
MGTGRMEAFSDGVIAIIITIMVLELKVPHGTDLAALRELAPVLASYVLSFVYVARGTHLCARRRHVDRAGSPHCWARRLVRGERTVITHCTRRLGPLDPAIPAAPYSIGGAK